MKLNVWLGIVSVVNGMVCGVCRLIDAQQLPKIKFSYDLIFFSFGSNVYINLNHKSHTENKKPQCTTKQNPTDCVRTHSNSNNNNSRKNAIWISFIRRWRRNLCMTRICLHFNWCFLFIFILFLALIPFDVMFSFWEVRKFSSQKNERKKDRNEIWFEGFRTEHTLYVNGLRAY